MNDPILDVAITYCAPCGYTERVVALTNEILSERELEYRVASWRLIPGTGGIFDVVVNGELIFSKGSVGRHAEPGEVKAALNAFLQATLADGEAS